MNDQNRKAGNSPLLFDFPVSAFAQKEPPIPQWIYEIPKEKNTIFFLGFSKSESSIKAKEESYKDALSNIEDYLNFVIGPALFGLEQKKRLEISKRLASSADELEVYYKREGSYFNCYNLVALNKLFLSADLKLYSKENGIEILDGVYTLVQSIGQPKIGYIWIGDYDPVSKKLTSPRIEHGDRAITPPSKLEIGDAFSLLEDMAIRAGLPPDDKLYPDSVVQTGTLPKGRIFMLLNIPQEIKRPEKYQYWVKVYIPGSNR